MPDPVVQNLGRILGEILYSPGNLESVKKGVDWPKSVGSNPMDLVSLGGDVKILPIREGGSFRGYHGTKQELDDILMALYEGKLGSGGFHLGTKQAAIDRLKYQKSVRGSVGAKIIKVAGPLGRSVGPVSDSIATSFLNTSDGAKLIEKLGLNTLLYKNQFEDPGSTSVVLLNRANKGRLAAPKSPFSLMQVRKFIFGLLLAALLGGAGALGGQSDAA